MKISIRPFFLLLLLTLSGFSLMSETKYQPAAAGTTSLKKLTTRGKEIVTLESGRPVILRGITFGGGVWDSPEGTTEEVDYYTGEQDFRNLTDWGVNCIVYYMDYRWFLTDKGFAHMEKIFGWCRKYNIYIIPHMTGYPVGGLRGGPEFFNNPRAMRQLRDFWIAFATRYRGHEEIAGYGILDEPHSGAASVSDQPFKNRLKSYMETIIDDVRKIDPDTPVFIETVYGSPYGFVSINPAKTHIVHNVHFYEPLGYTAGGFPWISAGGVPEDLSYPGTYAEKTTLTGESLRFTAKGGSHDWTTVEETLTVKAPAANRLYLSLFCQAGIRVKVWYDGIEYSVNGSPFTLWPNGSFEESWWGSVDTENALYWMVVEKNGFAGRNREAAFDGESSFLFADCSGLTRITTFDNWIATAGSIPVSRGDTVEIRYRYKSRALGHGQSGLVLETATVDWNELTRESLLKTIDRFILDRREAENRPFFVGEFSPSLASIRPGSLNYLADCLTSFNDNDLHWCYYVYRENWVYKSPRLGIFNGARGVVTEDCPLVDREVLETILPFWNGSRPN